MRSPSNQEPDPNTDIFPITVGPADGSESKLLSPTIHLVHTRHQMAKQQALRQAMRVRRLHFTSSMWGLYLLALAVFYTQGLVDRPTLIAAAIMIVLVLGMFYAIFLTGANQKAQEKNLTVPMMLFALAIMLWITYVAPATQIIFAPFVFIGVAFGMYRLTQKALLFLCAATLAIYGLEIGLHYSHWGNPALLKLELLYELVLALTLPGFVLITSRVRYLHSALFKAGVKIKNIEEHARRDQLIDCYNRRYMVAALEEQKRVSDKENNHLCLAVIDLDHFKHINDEIGHLGGDEVLRTFARVAQDSVRQCDIFGRYGGEEFLLILPETPLLAALNIAERIRDQVEHYPWNAKLQRPVTVSIGLTQYIPGESVLDLFSRTDTAMYLAKRGGRNQVVVEEPTVELWQ